jgi:hypothetical protein
MTIRSTGALSDRIRASAKANGRSISEEIEYLLNRSMWMDATYGETGCADTGLSGGHPIPARQGSITEA